MRMSPRHYQAQRVVTWAPRLKSQNFPSPLNFSFAKTVSSGNGTGWAELRGFAAADAAIQARYLCIEAADGDWLIGFPAPEPRQFQAEFSVTAIFRVRIVASLVAATALKVARKTPPCICKRGRWNPAFLESAEGVTQDLF